MFDLIDLVHHSQFAFRHLSQIPISSFDLFPFPIFLSVFQKYSPWICKLLGRPNFFAKAEVLTWGLRFQAVVG